MKATSTTSIVLVLIMVLYLTLVYADSQLVSKDITTWFGLGLGSVVIIVLAVLSDFIVELCKTKKG